MKKAKVYKRIDKEFLVPWQVEAPGLKIALRFETQQMAFRYVDYYMRTGYKFPKPEEDFWRHLEPGSLYWDTTPGKRFRKNNP